LLNSCKRNAKAEVRFADMPQPWRGPTIRAALILGFGAVVALWLLEGLQTADRVATAQQELAGISGRYAHAQELLSAARTNVLLASVSVRDALLDPDPGHTPEYLARVEAACQSAEDALARYQPILDTVGERDRVAVLAGEIRTFRSTAIELLATDRDLSPLEVQRSSWPLTGISSSSPNNSREPRPLQFMMTGSSRVARSARL
jgi:hypothetical protein